MKLTLEQNKYLPVTGGLETLGMCKMPGTKETFNIPLKGDQIDTSIFTKDELNFLEKSTGYKFTNEAGKQYYTSQILELDSSTQILDLEHPKDLLTYKFGVQMGYIAESEHDASDPNSKHRFYVYNSEKEEAVNAEKNELKGNVIAKLTELKVTKDAKLIYYAKYIFQISDKLTIPGAYNKIFEFCEKNFNNVKQVQYAFDQPFDLLRLSVDIKDAISANILKKEISGAFVNRFSGTTVGRNVVEIADFYRNPANADELEEGPKAKETSLRNLLKNINK